MRSHKRERDYGISHKCHSSFSSSPIPVPLLLRKTSSHPPNSANRPESASSSSPRPRPRFRFLPFGFLLVPTTTTSLLLLGESVAAEEVCEMGEWAKGRSERERKGILARLQQADRDVGVNGRNNSSERERERGLRDPRLTFQRRRISQSAVRVVQGERIPWPP